MQEEEQPDGRTHSTPRKIGKIAVSEHRTETSVARHKKGARSQPFSEHVRELRRRLLYIVATLLLGSIIGYIIHGSLFAIIRRPLHAQLYYTTPIGGFNAMIKISIMFGLIVTVPVFVYQIGKFLGPAFKHRIHARKIMLLSTSLAILGVLFAYFVSLPASLHFLANIDSKNLQSLYTVNEYLNFVSAYMAGFALLFQLPLIMLFINRIKPQRPGKLMSVERYVILASFILAAILTPTPDPINQTIMAVPIILLYQFSVLLVWLTNRKHKKIAPKPVPDAPSPAAYSESVYNAPTPVPSTPQGSAGVLNEEPRLITDIYLAPQNPIR